MYGDYYGRKNGGGKAIGAIVIAILVLVIGIGMVKSYYSEKTYQISVTEKDIKNYGDGGKFLVFAELEDGTIRVFSIEDTLIKGRWDSADDYARIQVGESYTVTVIGWRVPFLSWYENIIEIQ